MSTRHITTELHPRQNLTSKSSQIYSFFRKKAMNCKMKFIFLVVAMIICKSEQAAIKRMPVRKIQKNIHNNFVARKNFVGFMPVLSRDGLDRVLYAKFRKPVLVPRMIRIESGLTMIPFQEKELGFEKFVDQGVLSRISNFIRSTRVNRFRNVRLARIWILYYYDRNHINFVIGRIDLFLI